MPDYILVPLDGSPLAESALPLGVALARLTSSGIILLRAVPARETVETVETVQAEEERPAGAVAQAGRPHEISREELSAARQYLDTVVKHLEEGGLQVSTEIVEEAPADATVGYADQNPGVWLIAMATRHTNPSGPWAAGSVAGKVLHTAHKPVLLTRPMEDAGGGKAAGEGSKQPPEQAFHTIIVPLDGSRFAEEALIQARRLAQLTSAALVLVCAIPPANNGYNDQVGFNSISGDMARGYAETQLARYLANTAEKLRAEGLDVHIELVHGHPAEMILLTARRLRADLIVMAARGRRDFERLWLGSTAQKLVQGSTMPVLLIRPTAPVRPPAASRRPAAASNGERPYLQGL